MPTQEYAASIQGVSIRVTRLDAAGKLQTGPGDSYTTSAFMRLSFTPEYEEGDEITEKGANGAVCVTFKSPDTLKRITMELAICEPDPELSALLSGGLLLRKNVGTFAAANNLSVGWASPGVGDDPAGNGVAIEAWSWAVKDGKRASTRPYFHWVFPFVKLRQSGDRVIENGVLANTFQGYGLGNSSFSSGIDGRWEFPTAAERPYAYSRATWAPIGLNGFFTWNYTGEGASELGTPEYAAVNSLDGLNYTLKDYAITGAGAITLDTGSASTNTTASHTYSVGDSITVANTDLTYAVTNKAIAVTTTTASSRSYATGTSFTTITTAANHGLVSGDRFTISGSSNTAYNGTWVATTGTGTTSLIFVTGKDLGAITDGTVTNSIVTLTTSASHLIVQGDKILVSIGDTAFDGTYAAEQSTTGTTIKYFKATATAVTSVAVNSPSAVVTRSIFNGSYTALTGTTGAAINYARVVSVTNGTAKSTTTTLPAVINYTATAHGLVDGQTVTTAGFVTNTAFNVSTGSAVSVIDANTFRLVTGNVSVTDATSETITGASVSSGSWTGGRAQLTRGLTTGTAITTVNVPTTSGASASSAVAGTASTTGYNVPGNLAFNADQPIDRVIKSNEDPTS
jgi:hypothetical protein